MKLPAFKSIGEKRDELRPKDLHFRKECGDYTCGAHKSWNEGFNAAIEIRDQMWALKVEKLIEALETLECLVDTDHMISETEDGEKEYWVNDSMVKHVCESALAEFYNNSRNDKLSRKETSHD